MRCTVIQGIKADIIWSKVRRLPWLWLTLDARIFSILKGRHLENSFRGTTDVKWGVNWFTIYLTHFFRSIERPESCTKAYLLIIKCQLMAAHHFEETHYINLGSPGLNLGRKWEGTVSSNIHKITPIFKQYRIISLSLSPFWEKIEALK